MVEVGPHIRSCISGSVSSALRMVYCTLYCDVQLELKLFCILKRFCNVIPNYRTMVFCVIHFTNLASVVRHHLATIHH